MHTACIRHFSIRQFPHWLGLGFDQTRYIPPLTAPPPPLSFSPPRQLLVDPHDPMAWREAEKARLQANPNPNPNPKPNLNPNRLDHAFIDEARETHPQPRPGLDQNHPNLLTELQAAGGVGPGVGAGAGAGSGAGSGGGRGQHGLPGGGRVRTRALVVDLIRPVFDAADLPAGVAMFRPPAMSSKAFMAAVKELGRYEAFCAAGGAGCGGAGGGAGGGYKGPVTRRSTGELLVHVPPTGEASALT